MSLTALRGRQGLALALLVCVGLAFLLARTPSRARAAQAPARAATTLQPPAACPNGSSPQIFLGASGANLLSETSLTVCVTGHVTVTFAGDPASGCAPAGLCGYTGTETFDPAGAGQLVVDRFNGRRGHYATATMVLGGDPGSPLVSTVQRSRANGATTTCHDRDRDAGGFTSLPVSGDRIAIGLAHAQDAFLGTRCAGPVDADIAAALTSRTVSLSRILHGTDTIDLRSDRRFASHGLAGTVRSTIVLVLRDPQRIASPRSKAPANKRVRLVNVAYRVTQVGGSVIATVGSSPLVGACSPFDACGLRGTVVVTPATTPGASLSLFAVAPLRRPKRDVLTALGLSRHGNPSGIAAVGAGFASRGGTVTADLTQDGTCQDQVGLPGTGMAMLQRKHRLEVWVSPEHAASANPLGTRCPGPALGSHLLTSASIPTSVLHHPTFTIKLHGSSFSNGPYRVTTHSTLTVTLHREKVTDRILP